MQIEHKLKDSLYLFDLALYVKIRLIRLFVQALPDSLNNRVSKYPIRRQSIHALRSRTVKSLKHTQVFKREKNSSFFKSVFEHDLRCTDGTEKMLPL